MRIVIDSNVLLAAFGHGGICRALLDVCIQEHSIYLSEYILEEVSRHLQTKFRHTAEQAEQRVRFLRDVTELVIPCEVPAGACRDADDLPVLGTALMARAEYLVTGDRDLLDLGRFVWCTVVSPAQLWQRLRAVGS